MRRVGLGWVAGGMAVVALAAGCGQATLEPPTRRATDWPDLAVIDDYPNPHGDTCGPEGLDRDGTRPSETKARSNRLKNRFRLPGRYRDMPLREMLALEPKGDWALNDVAVSVVAYVRDVEPGGRGGESANCGATRSDLLDAHIELTVGTMGVDPQGREMVVAETTERVRRLAKAGLLKSNVGNDWSTKALRKKLRGRWVRMSGWLFYDSDHRLESWSLDPKNRKGRKNWRGTPWEIHPVMAIEVLERPPN